MTIPRLGISTIGKLAGGNGTGKRRKQFDQENPFGGSFFFSFSFFF
jgi:hypothetical protein